MMQPLLKASQIQDVWIRKPENYGCGWTPSLYTNMSGDNQPNSVSVFGVATLDIKYYKVED